MNHILKIPAFQRRKAIPKQLKDLELLPLNQQFSKLTMPIVSDDDLRPIMNGNFFDMESKKIASTDAHKLTAINMPNETFNFIKQTYKKELNENPKGLIFHTLSQLQKDYNELVKLAEKNKYNDDFQSFDEYVKFRAIEDGRYPNYEAVTPKEFTNVINVDYQKLYWYAKVLLDAKVIDDVIKINTSNANEYQNKKIEYLKDSYTSFLNPVTKQIILTYISDDGTIQYIGFNARLLCELLKFAMEFNGKTFGKVGLSGNSRAMVIELENGLNVLTDSVGLVMPIFFNNDENTIGDIDFDLNVAMYYDLDTNSIVSGDAIETLQNYPIDEKIGFIPLKTNQNNFQAVTFTKQKEVKEIIPVEIEVKTLSIDDRIKGLKIVLKLAKGDKKALIEKRIKGLEIVKKMSSPKVSVADSKINTPKNKPTAKKLAEKLMNIKDEVFDSLNINSGSELYGDIEIQKKFVDAMKIQIENSNIKEYLNLFGEDIFNILEDNNYHSLNNFLVLGKYIINPKQYDYYVNSAIEYPKSSLQTFDTELQISNTFSKGGRVYNFSDYSNDALSDMIINLSRYENNEEYIEIVKEELKKRRSKNIEINQKMAYGGSVKNGYMVFNYTDNLYATNEIFATKNDAKRFIDEFKKRFVLQGYYRDGNMNKIDINDVDLYVLDADFNPYKFSEGGIVTYANLDLNTNRNIIAKAIEFISGTGVDAESMTLEGKEIRFKYRTSNTYTTISQKLISDTIRTNRKSLELRGKNFAKGGMVEYFDYKGVEIMYEPTYEEYFVNDLVFNSLEKAHNYIDSGEANKTPKYIEDLYRRGMMAKGGGVVSAKLKKLKSEMKQIWEETGEQYSDKKEMLMSAGYNESDANDYKHEEWKYLGNDAQIKLVNDYFLFYEKLAVYVQGVGSIYNGTSMQSAVNKANSYLKNNPKAEIVISDEKYGDTYDLDGYMIDEEFAKGGNVKNGINWYKYDGQYEAEFGNFFLYISPSTQRGYYNVRVTDGYRGDTISVSQQEILGIDNAKKLAIDIVGDYMKQFKKGGIVVTSIKDIPNFNQRNKENKITYRGLGLGKLFNDFYDIAGEQGTRIKVDGKEYFITNTEFNTFSRDNDGRMRIRFDAPYRKN